MAKKAFKAKEPIKIRFKKLANGNRSIYLDYWNGETSTRQYEFLNLYLIPDTLPEAKERNEYTMTVANTIKNDKLRGLINGKAGIKEQPQKGNILFSDFAQQYINKHKNELAKNTIVVYESAVIAVNRFSKNLQLKDFDKKQLQKFIEFLRGYGITQSSQVGYLIKVGRLLKVAYSKGLISTNPMLEIDSQEKPKMHTAKREYLEKAEVKRLIDTECNEKIKIPFLFCCFCGLRLVDVKALKWDDNIKVINGKLSIEIIQQKTGEPVVIPLTKNALKYLPERRERDTVFEMYDDVWTNLKLKEWAKKAGINKNVTFHTARHTYATMNLTAGGDLYTVSKLLGHTDIKTTQIYADIVNQKKQEMANQLDNYFDE